MLATLFSLILKTYSTYSDFSRLTSGTACGVIVNAAEAFDMIASELSVFLSSTVVNCFCTFGFLRFIGDISF